MGPSRAPQGIFLSTPSARRATSFFSSTSLLYLISIHALREEGDDYFRALSLCRKPFLSTPSARRATPHPPRPRRPHQISIHALREEGDAQAIAEDDGEWEFLSTPSARRATADKGNAFVGGNNFYPRPPRGGRR